MYCPAVDDPKRVLQMCLQVPDKSPLFIVRCTVLYKRNGVPDGTTMHVMYSYKYFAERNIFSSCVGINCGEKRVWHAENLTISLLCLGVSSCVHCLYTLYAWIEKNNSQYRIITRAKSYMVLLLELGFYFDVLIQRNYEQIYSGKPNTVCIMSLLVQEVCVLALGFK